MGVADDYAYLLKTGGPAAPTQVSNNDGSTTTFFGMTVLDRFAEQAMVTILGSMQDKAYNPEEIAAHAYRQARAMLAEKRRINEQA